LKTVFVSEKGDDGNDGSTHERPVYSWERALKIQDGRNDIEIHFLDLASKHRCTEEAQARGLRQP
jgi:hypothetical protein